MFKNCNKINSFITLMIVVALFAPSVSVAAAGVPKILNNQGRLMDANGALLGGGGTDFCFKFSLYDNSVVGAGSKVWPTSSPSTMTAVVKNGVFNVGVGDVSAGGDVLDFNFQDTDAVYLNVEVAAKVGATCAPGDGAESFETLGPRQRVFASGYAINADTVRGFGAAQNATGNLIPVLTDGNLVLGGVNPNISATTTNVLTLQGSSTGNIQFFGAGNTLSSSGDLTIAGRMASVYASSTGISSAYASSTNGFFGSLSVGNLSGVVRATAGSLSTGLVNLATDVTGFLGVTNGGTGTSTAPTQGQLLVGNAAGGYDLLATSSLGLLSAADLSGYLTLANYYSTTTDGLDEGLVNKYFTVNRVAEVIAGTTTDALAQGTTNKYYSTLLFASDLAGTTTNALAEGSTNFYFTTARATTSFVGNLAATTSVASITALPNLSLTSSQVSNFNTSVDAYINASTTIPKTYTNNTFGGTQTFTNSSTSLASFTYASSTNGFFGSLSVGSLSGVLKATAGSIATSLVSLTSDISGILQVGNGGTGWSTFTSGTLLTGNGSGQLATTTIGSSLLLSGSALSLNTANANTWSALQQFSNASSSLLSIYNGFVGNLFATSSATLASTTAYGRFITGNIIATSTATSTFTGPLSVGVANASTPVSFMGSATAPTGATGTAILTVSNDNNTLSSGNNVLRLNLRTAYGTACVTGTTCPRFMEFFTGLPSGSDTGGRGVGSLRLSTAGTGITQTSGSADFAEFMQLNSSAATGDLVSLNAQGEYQKAVAGQSLVGVISENPAFVGNANIEGETNAYIVGFAGVIPTTVSTANGPINAGDLIAASTTPGVGVKLQESGYALGQALQSYSGAGTSSITVLVMPKFVDAAIALESYGGSGGGVTGYWDLATTTGTVSLASTTYSLVVGGTSTFTNASTTNLSSAYASSTRGFFGSLSVGNLSGVVRATAGSLSTGLVNLATEVTGFLSVTNGGTGTSTAPAAGQVLLGNAVGGYDLVSTSSLGISAGATVWGSITGTLSNQTDLQTALNAKLNLSDWYSTTTTDIEEGNNLYFTAARANSNFASNLAATTTTALAEGTNLYFTTARATTSFIGNLAATSSVNSITTLNSLTGVSTSLTGLVRATAGSLSTSLVSLTSDISGILGIANGGTGTSTAPTYGKLLVGNASGAYDLVATSSLGFANAGDLSAYLTLSNWYSTTTDALDEGTNNVYFTTARATTSFIGNLAATSSVNSITTLNNLSLPATQLTSFGTPFYQFFSATTTNALAEGSTNFYFTTARATTSFVGNLAATSSVASVTALPNLSLPATQLTQFGVPFYNFLSATNTSALAEGGNLYFTTARATTSFVGNLAATTSVSSITTLQNLSITAAQISNLSASVDSYINASTTIPKTYTANSFTGTQTFTNSSTSLASFAYASSTNGFFGSLSIGSLSGVLKATAGAISASAVNLAAEVTGFLGVTNGGTGTSTAPVYGQLLVGNAAGGYDYYATSSLGLLSSTQKDWSIAFGALTPTTTLGLLISASSTIGNGLQAGGLTISGGATTTGNLVVQGIGTTTIAGGLEAWRQISAPYFNATSSATSTFVGGIQANLLNITGSATSTFANGVNVTNGCLAINGACITAGTPVINGGGALINIQTFIADGTYTPTSGATNAMVIVTAGGGGGGGADSTDGATTEIPGGGGGAGGTTIDYLDLTGISSVGVVVGAGGAGGPATGGTGSAGGYSYFGNLVGADPGLGGVGATDSTAGPRTLAGGAGAVASSTGSIPVAGGEGLDGYAPANGAYGGAGGASYWGGGGNGGTVVVTATAAAGNSASASGAGGGGAGLADTVNGQAGGNGAAGVIVVYEYGPSSGVLDIAHGGTGTSISPVYGQLLVGNASGGYDLVSTSSLGISGGGASFGQAFELVNGVLTPTTTVGLIVSASSTFAGGFSANTATITAATTTSLFTSNFTLGSITGFLKAAAGVVTNALIDLANDVSGILGVANGGTGQSAIASNAILLGNGTGPLATTSIGLDGQVLALVGGIPTWQATTTLATISGVLGETKGGTGQSSFTIGDILYANGANSLARLPIGSAGQVLKVNSGLPVWGVDQTSGGGGGGGAGFFSTTTDELAIYPTDTSDVVIIGNNATATTNSIFEVSGRSYFSNRVGIATTSPGSIFSIGGVANFDSEGSTLYSTLTLGRLVATSSLFANVFGANFAGVGTIATTTIQGDATGTSTFQGFIDVLGTNSTSTFSGGLAVATLALTGSATSTAANGISIQDGCFAIAGNCIGGVESVTAGDTTLTVSPTNGDIVVSLNLANANIWTGLQTFNNATTTLLESVLHFAQTIQSTSTNALVFKSSLTSSAGLTLGSTSTPQMLALNTQSNRVALGTGGATPVVFVLDTKNTAGDPTGVDGAMYYNSNTSEYRCHSGTVWRTCGGIAASSTGDVQVKNSDGSFTATANFNWSLASNGLTIKATSSAQRSDLLTIASTTGNPMFAFATNGALKIATTTEPATSTNMLNFYARDFGGRLMPEWQGPTGVDTPFQSSLGFSNVAVIAPGSGSTATTYVTAVGAPQFSVSIGTGGTFTVVTPTSGSLLNQTRRFQLGSAAGTANTGAYIKHGSAAGTNPQQVWRGDAAGLGGFFFSARFATGALSATAFNYIGLYTTPTTAPTSANPITSTTYGKIGVATASNTGNWQFVHNTPGVAPTPIDLGTNFPISTTGFYEIVIYAAPNDSKVSYRATNLTTGAEVTGVVTTNLPTATTFMGAVAWTTNGGTAAANNLQLSRIYLETDY